MRDGMMGQGSHEGWEEGESTRYKKGGVEVDRPDASHGIASALQNGGDTSFLISFDLCSEHRCLPVASFNTGLFV